MPMPVIHGYAAVFYNPDDPGTEGVAEDGVTWLRIMPGAFDESVDWGECEAWFSHRERRDLGGVDDGNLVIGVDGIGLWYRLRVMNPNGRNVARRIERGRLAGSSWQGWIRDSFTFTSGDGRRVRECRKIDLLEVGPCTFPRFPAATCWLGTGETVQDDAERIARELSRMRLAETS